MKCKHNHTEHEPCPDCADDEIKTLYASLSKLKSALILSGYHRSKTGIENERLTVELTEAEGAVADLMEEYDKLEATNQRLRDEVESLKLQNDCHSGTAVCLCYQETGYPCHNHTDSAFHDSQTDNQRLRDDLNAVTEGKWTQTEIDAGLWRAYKVAKTLEGEGE